jgi:hypothetical protein
VRQVVKRLCECVVLSDLVVEDENMKIRKEDKELLI